MLADIRLPKMDKAAQISVQIWKAKDHIFRAFNHIFILLINHWMFHGHWMA